MMGQRFSSALLNKAYNFSINAQYPDFEGFAVTPADGTDLGNGPTKAVYVTVGGNIAVNLAGGGTATLTGLVAGQILPIAAQRILATGTTATGIFALY